MVFLPVKGRRIASNVDRFKPIYNTLESQTVFVRGLLPKTPAAGAALPPTSQLNLIHFAWVRLARLNSNDLQIILLHYPLG